MVMEDYLLDNQYLLKKGSTVMMPSPVQHQNPGVWGDDGDVFNHQRFLGGKRNTSQQAFALLAEAQRSVLGDILPLRRFWRLVEHDYAIRRCVCLWNVGKEVRGRSGVLESNGVSSTRLRC
jgi:cytochrome P450